MDDGNSVTTKLLTLLNVSATKIGKRKRTYEDHLGLSDKLNKRKSASFADESVVEEGEKDETKTEDVDMEHEKKEVEEEAPEGGEDEEEESAS